MKSLFYKLFLLALLFSNAIFAQTCLLGAGPGATGGNGQVDYSKWNITGLASSNAWYNQTNAATTHLNPATQNIKYGDVPGSTLAPTSSGVAPVSMTLGSVPFYDEQTSLSVGHFTQIEGYIGIPCDAASIQFAVVNDGSGVGGSSVRENYSSLHLAVNGGNLTTNASDLTLVSKMKTNFSGTPLDTDPVTAGIQNLISPVYSFAQAGKWVRFADVVSNGAQRYGTNIRWSINGGPFVNVPSSAFQSITGGLASISSCPCPTLEDCDMDGIPNIADIDDDNDGVLDTVEGTLACNGVYDWTSLTFAEGTPSTLPGTFTVKGNVLDNNTPDSISGTVVLDAINNANDFGLTFNANGSITNTNSISSAANDSLQYTITYNQPIDLCISWQGGIFDNVEDYTITYTSASSSISGLPITNLAVTQTANSYFLNTTVDVSSANMAPLEICFTGLTQIVIKRKDAGAGAAESGFRFRAPLECYIDTDNDNMPNSCDLDSDGDGCADAVEAGNVPSLPSSAWTSTTVYPTNQPATTSSTLYTKFSLDSTKNFCLTTLACGTLVDSAFVNWNTYGTTGNGYIANGSIPTASGSINVIWDINNPGNTNGASSLGFGSAPLFPEPTVSPEGIAGVSGRAPNTTGIITFSSPVTNPIIHFANLDYNGYVFTGILPADIVEVGGNSNATIGTSGGNAFIRSTTSNTTNTGCAGISVCGSFMLIGTYSTINYSTLANPTGTSNAVDGHTVTTGFYGVTGSSCPVPGPDTVTVTPACPTCPVTACATADDLPTTPGTTTYTSCGTTPAGFGTTSAVNPTTGCITFTPNGTQGPMDTVKTCVVACKNGVCDTTYIIIPPVVVPDTVTLTPACPTCPVTACATADDLPTTPGTTTYTSCGTTPAGFGTTSAVNPTTGCITFTPNGTQGPMDTVKTCVIACKNGVCDTTYIIIPPVVVPDTVTVTPACPTCPVTACATADDLPTTPGTTIYTSSGTTPAGFGTTSAVNPTTGCITFTPNGTQGPMDTVKTCVIACKNGVCDTTYIIIPPVVVPDTVTVTPACPICPVTVCATADDIDTTSGGVIYSSCGTTPAGFGTTSAVNPTTGCITFTPNGTQGPMDTVKTCVIACKNGVCDTTYIIIPPVVVPDTVTVTPACPTCPVTACATADDLPTTPGTTTYTSCGTTPAGFGTTSAVNPTTGCITFTPNGTQGPMDTVKTCVIACKNGVCDTTYIIIPPVVVPDTVTVTPACPTCPVTECATADDLSTNPGSTSYTSCGVTPAGFGTQTLNPTTGCVTFYPNGSQGPNDTVKTCVVACKLGVCDTTYIIIPPVVIPDTVIKTPACPTCPVPVCATQDDIDTSGGGTTYSTCGAPTEYSLVGPDANGCLTLIGNGIQDNIPDTTCVIACKNGICDTTVIIINPPIIPDSIIIQAECPTCYTPPICATADDLPVGTGTTTYSSCPLTPSGFGTTSFINPTTGCFVFTGNLSFTMDTLQTCIVACKNGICDTTYITILPAVPPYGPDTVKTQVACATCPTSLICPTADDLPSTGTLSYSNCGLDANETTQGSMIIDANGCAVWTPNGTQTETITTCVVACKSNGMTTVCDTTFIIILPPPTPDTITKTPECTTCPVTICPTADDVPLYGVVAYQSCGLDSAEATQGTLVVDINGCAVWTPNGTQTDTITTCIVKCVDGICDTTFIIIPPVPLVPNPDVNATWANVPIIGDVNTNDNGYPSTTTYGTPNPQPGNPGPQVPVLNTDGTYTFTLPIPGIYTYLVPVQACPTCPIDSVLLTITVLDSTINTNNPTANTDLATTPKNTSVTLPTLSNDGSTNIGGLLNPATVLVTDSPKNGTITVNSLTGETTYTPNLGFVGKDTLYYEVCDYQVPAKCATAMQVITIIDTATSQNSTLASDDFNHTSNGNPVSGNALGNDTDAEGDGQTVTPQITEIPGKGTLVLNADGSYVFTPAPGYVGPVNFPYEITDAKGAKANATIYFLITPNIALPIKLSDINLSSINCHVDLSWTTILEENASHFEIYRKKGASDFKLIHSLNVFEGNSNTTRFYKFIDENVENGVYEYKLRMVDIDAKYSYSNVVSTKVNCTKDDAISIYPNPTNNYFTIDLSKTITEEDINVKLIDITGKIVRVKTIDSKISKVVEVDVMDVAQGAYIIEITNIDLGKFVKMVNVIK